MWELTPETQTQLDFALAIAAENLGESETAAPFFVGKVAHCCEIAGTANGLCHLLFWQKRLNGKRSGCAVICWADALTRLNALVESSPTRQTLAKQPAWFAYGYCRNCRKACGSLGLCPMFPFAMLEPNDPARLGVEYCMARIFKRQE